MPLTRVDLRNATLCGVMALLAIAATWPLANTPFDDDWSYTFTAKRFAETGHIIYNGWSSPSVVGQAVYAWPWIKLLGFSFQTMRLSMAPLAAASVATAYLLGRRAGLPAAWSCFAAALLATSPLFLPLATSFMTDVPALLCFLVSAYAAIAAAEAASTSGAVGWLVVSLAVAAVGGSSRQIVWLVPFVLLPYAAWLRRVDRPFVAIAVLGWLANVAAAFAVQHWFQRQPFSIPEPSLGNDLATALADPWNIVHRFAGVLLTGVLLVLPATAGLAFAGGGGPRGRIAFRGSAAFVVIVVVAALIGERAWAPWMDNMITPTGVMSTYELYGSPPVVLGWPIRVAMTLPVFAVVAVATARLTLVIGRASRSLAIARDFFLRPPTGRAAGPALLLLSAGYLGLLLSRCAPPNVPFDRHLLPLIPCLAIPLLAVIAPTGRATVVAWVSLAVFAAYGIASTQDEIARARAVWLAIGQLRSLGVPKGHLDGGFEFDSWTELEVAGHVNDDRVTVPAGAYDPAHGELPHYFALYRVQYEPRPDTVPAASGTIRYFTLIPPFHHQIYLGRILHPVTSADLSPVANPARR
jgi:hypothetical protein